MFGSPWLSSCVDLKLFTYGLGWCTPNFSVDLAGLLAEKSWYQHLWVSVHREDSSSLQPGGFRAGCSILGAERKRDRGRKGRKDGPRIQYIHFHVLPLFLVCTAILNNALVSLKPGSQRPSVLSCTENKILDFCLGSRKGQMPKVSCNPSFGSSSLFSLPEIPGH